MPFRREGALRILLIGGGGREHAIAWALSKSPQVEKVFCAPGNGGTSNGFLKIENCSPSIGALDFNALLDFATVNGVNLVVPCPDAPLVKGITDHFRRKGFRVFGPSMDAARIEGSKYWAKDFMTRHGIPTATYRNFSAATDAFSFIEEQSETRFVVKASGLAVGKGVILTDSKEDAMAAIKDIMIDRIFGDAGDEIVIEEFLFGREISLTLITDGNVWKLFPAGQDAQRILDGNLGENTGGMGVCVPLELLSNSEFQQIESTILRPTIDGLKSEGYPFVGFICIGLMQTSVGLKLIEYNARFGDPEAQTLLPLMDSDSDLAEIMSSCIDGRLQAVHLGFEHKAAVSVVMAADGYPKLPQIGQLIQITPLPKHILLFHAGTKKKDDDFQTSGGRVLASVCVADSVKEAVQGAYEGVGYVHFSGKYYRTDIGSGYVV
ncbi:hypothetical protein QQX98_006244 [Neonectria punicea]|uniref:phosphoribosylamine--glycine ligase n=1 Tax=Neonectria punicea TaxID=979145 RepID=A0ABR1H216_9HYPO